MRFWYKNLALFFIKISSIFYQSPANFTYWWNFGILSLYFLIAQIVSGVFLAMYYNPSIFFAHASIIYINTEVYYGWWVRYLHANGASLFFFCVYVHLFRGIYYGSYLFPRQLLWVTGVILLALMIVTAFLGYVLPWGQMSFWAAIVITTLLSTIPLIGADIVFLLWGCFSINDMTLYRFFVLHFFLPFVMLSISILHILCLHEFGSNNKTCIVSILDGVPFSPYYTIKDAITIFLGFFIISVLIFFIPDILGHVLNYDLANFLTTPPHIVPEWYFWFFYAILRSIPSKGLGFLCLICSLLAIMALPYLSKNFLIRSTKFKIWHRMCFVIFLCVCLYLGWIGSIPILQPYISVGRFLTFVYFLILLVCFPLEGKFERFVLDCYCIIGRKKLSFKFKY